MMKRRLTSFLLSLTLLLSLPGCTGAGTTPTPTETPTPTATPTPTPVPVPVVFTLPCFSEQSFHPISGGSKTNRTLSPLLYEGLYELDSGFTPHPLLCESATVSEDALSWTFTLRQGVSFSDGSVMTAADVADSLRQAMAVGSSYASRLAGVSSVVAVDAATLTVVLSAPNGNLPALLDVPVVKGTGERPAGTGPYALVEEEGGLRLALRPDRWRTGAMPMESIPLYPIQEGDAMVRAFDTRAISLVDADLTGANAMGYSGSYEIWEYPTTSMLYLGYNTNPISLCSDPALRAALARTVAREEIAKALLAGHAAPAALPVPPASPLYDETLAKGYGEDSTQAAALLEQAGWVLGEDGVRTRGRETLSLVLLTSAENTYKLAVAQRLTEALTAVGVAVTLRSVPWSDYVSALEKGEFDLYLGETRLTANFDLSALIAPGGTLNYGAYADVETQALLSAYLAAGDTARGPAANALYTKVAETAPFTPICFKTCSVLTHWGWLTGLSPTQQNIFYDFASWKWSG